MFCSSCAAEIADGVLHCSQCGGAQPPDKNAAVEALKTCPKCQRNNWRVSRACYSCQTPFEGRRAVSPRPEAKALAPRIDLQDIRDRLPPKIQELLVVGEPAYAYSNPKSCGSANNTLVITDSRVIMSMELSNGFNTSQSSRVLEIPIDQVSAVTDERIGSGCGSSRSIAIRSSSAGLSHFRSGKPGELDGAFKVLQALIRARGLR